METNGIVDAPVQAGPKSSYPAGGSTSSRHSQRRNLAEQQLCYPPSPGISLYPRAGGRNVRSRMQVFVRQREAAEHFSNRRGGSTATRRINPLGHSPPLRVRCAPFIKQGTEA